MINDLKVTEIDLWKYVDDTTLAEILPIVSVMLDLIITKSSPGYFVSSGTLSLPANCDHCI
jgi:hypothetical protein